MDGPLVTASWLLRHLLEPALRVVDVRWYLTEPERGRREYDTAHIPGAVFMDIDRDLAGVEGAGRHPMPDWRVFAARLGAAGIGNEHDVVAYDDSVGAVAGRLWWMLRHVGHDRVRVLDGGFAAWEAADYPTTAAKPDHEPVPFAIDETSDDTIDRDELRSRLGSVVLLDARARERYTGESEPVDPVAGHIPTALSAPYDEFVRPNGTLLDPSDLRSRFAELGAAGSEQVVVYCGSGVSSCHHLLAMAAAGIEGAKLYPGSWSDWSTSGYPVAVGPEPGDPPG